MGASDTLRQWAAEDRAAAEAKRTGVTSVEDQANAIELYSAFAPTEADKQQLLAQAAELRAASAGDESAASTLDACAEGWETIAEAIDGS